MRTLLIVSHSFNSVYIFSQIPDAKRDFQWLVGYKDSSEKTVINLFDFNKTPFELKPFPIHLGILPRSAPSHISDTSGQMILYATGCDLLNYSGQIISNGHHMTPDNWVYDDYCPDYYPFVQSLLMLSDPANDAHFYLFALGHRQSTGAGIHAWGLYASRFSEQEVFEKNTLICADTLFRSHLKACRHANGRDWWIVLNKIKSNRYYKYLLDSTGIHFIDLQAIGDATTWEASATGQSAFSPDGTLFIHYDNVTDMFVYDFDRCSGALSNFRQVSIENNEDSGNSLGGMAISPNSRFAYTFGYLYSYQIDLQAPDLQASVTQVAYWDSTYVNNVWPTVFGRAALAPDGKIYAAVPGSNPYMHIIHNPNVKADSCQFEQHGLFLPYSWNTNTMPNFPNFRLGRMEGSACDTVYTRVNDLAQSLAVRIYPNPSDGTFQLLSPITGRTHLKLFDITGRMVWSKMVEGSEAYFTTTNVPSGCYFLDVRDSQNSLLAIKRLIIH